MKTLKNASATDTATSEAPNLLSTEARRYGSRKKSPIEKHTEKMTVPVIIIPHCFSSFAASSAVICFLFSISSSSSAANSADHMREETPTTIESMNAATPRMIGIFESPSMGITLL